MAACVAASSSAAAIGATQLALGRDEINRGMVDATRYLDPPPTDEDRAAFDHFRRTGEVLGAAPPAAAEE